MGSLKLLHIGDMHIDYDPKYKIKIEHSLNQIIGYCRANEINAVIIPGDIWHREQSYSDSSGVPMLVGFLKELSKLVGSIFIAKGNHDKQGSIELLHQLEKNVYATEVPVVLGVFREKEEIIYLDLLRSDFQEIAQDSKQPEFITNLIPYPTKSTFITDTSIDTNNQNFENIFDNLLIALGMINNKFSCPKVMGFHGNVQGARLSNGQTLGQDLIISPKSLQKANCDYYALSHIHLQQEITPNMIYAGGIANFNWGETEQKSIQAVKFENGHMEIERILLKGTRPMIEVKAEFKDGKFVYDNHIPENAEVRFRYRINEDEAKVLTNDKIEELKKQIGDDKDIRMDKEIVPTVRESRSEKIMDARGLTAEVEEYANVVSSEITNSIRKKIAIVEEMAAQL